MLQLIRFALRFIHSLSGATGVFWPDCRFVYFRFEAKMTDASSKIDIRRLKWEFTNENITTLCITRLFSVGRYQRPSNPATASS